MTINIIYEKYILKVRAVIKEQAYNPRSGAGERGTRDDD